MEIAYTYLDAHRVYFFYMQIGIGRQLDVMRWSSGTAVIPGAG
jgi:hypothetical protein